MSHKCKYKVDLKDLVDLIIYSFDAQEKLNLIASDKDKKANAMKTLHFLVQAAVLLRPTPGKRRRKTI